MNLDLAGKCAIVGGASQGIGYGIAHLLAAEGARVAITGAPRQRPARRRRKDGGGNRRRDLAGAGRLPSGRGLRTRCRDCRSVRSVTSIFWSTMTVRRRSGDLATFDDVAWQKAIEQNFMYVARMCRGVLPHMQKTGGSILNITAISAIQPIPRFGLSVASWGAVIGYAKTLALEAARFGINVNTICPGYVDTQRLEKVFSAGDKPAQQMRSDARAGSAARAHRHGQRHRKPRRAARVSARQLHHRHRHSGRWRAVPRRPLREEAMAYVNMMPAELAAKYTREKLWLQKTVFDILAERAASASRPRRHQGPERRHQLRRSSRTGSSAPRSSIVRSASSAATSSPSSFPTASNSPSPSSRSNCSAPSPTRSIRTSARASSTTC